MLLEQITTDYENDDDQQPEEQPTPKGYVRTEMGRLVKKKDQDAWDKGFTKAMQDEWKGRGAAALKAKKTAAALKSMKKK